LSEIRTIDVLSDSTGETAEKVVRAALLQFPHSGVQIRLHTRVRTRESARPVLERAAHEGALVVFTVVSPELREYIHASSYELRVEALDLIGSLIGKLGTYLDRQPINTPSAMLPLSDEYFRRIEAVEFTVKSDDGKEPRNFKKADIVLVGVSRTSKTPLSTILAQRGLKVANLPIVLGVPPPRELEEAPQDRIVFGLAAFRALLAKVLQPCGRCGDVAVDFGPGAHLGCTLRDAKTASHVARRTQFISFYPARLAELEHTTLHAHPVERCQPDAGPHLADLAKDQSAIGMATDDFCVLPRLAVGGSVDRWLCGAHVPAPFPSTACASAITCAAHAGSVDARTASCAR